MYLGLLVKQMLVTTDLDDALNSLFLNFFRCPEPNLPLTIRL